MSHAPTRFGAALARAGVTVALMAIGATGCGGGAADVTARTEEPPWGLTAVEMPADAADIDDLFAALPDVVDGRPRTQPFDERTQYSAHYGEGDEQGITLFAIPTEQTAELAGEAVTPLEWLSAASGEMEGVEDSVLDPDEPLSWVASGGEMETGPGVMETFYVAMWGKPEGEWIFWITADSEAGRTALIHAFLDAVED